MPKTTTKPFAFTQSRTLFSVGLAVPFAMILLYGRAADAQFGVNAGASGPATPASPKFVQAYHQGYTLIASNPAVASGSGLGQSTDVGIAAIDKTVRHLEAVSVAVKVGWTDTTPDDQKGLVGGEVETAIRMSIGPNIAAISVKLPGCKVDNPMTTPGFVATTIPAIDGGKDHYINLLEKTAVAYRQEEECIQPGYGAAVKVAPTSATGHQGVDSAIGILPGGSIIRDAVKTSKDGQKMKAAEENKGAVQVAVGINGPALQAEAAAHNLSHIMKVPDEQ